MADVQEPRNALWRREEQLQRWNQSDTNKVTAEPKTQELVKVKFQDGCVFLAACSSGDRDEVKRLLARGADINTANIDGLTALHQACIDDNLEMVQFLVELGAEIDACDNEGWTPLHATASCDFIDIAKYLIEQGASVSAVNNDGELPIDIADSDEMEQLLFEEMEQQGVDADAARQEEEEMMLRDANQWLSSKAVEEEPHPKTGATALHVAAAKGYSKVMRILIDAGVNYDARDNDGWTPLHAAAHWGQEEACKILVENFCNMDEKNLVGQTVFDVAEPNLVPFLEDLKKKQATLKKDREAKMQETILTRPAPLKRRSSVTRMSVDQKQNVNLKNVEEERQQLEAMRQKRLEDTEEKNNEDASSESATESSDSETEKQNEINRRGPIPPKSEEMDVSSEKPKIQAEKEKETPKIEETKSPPPDKPPSQTPRIQDIAKSEELQRDADKENERQSNKQTEKEREIEKGLLKKEKEDFKKKDDFNKADKIDEVKAEENEKDKRLSNGTSKPLLLRTISAPPPSSKATPGGRQVPNFTPKPLGAKTERASIEGPASWRAGLRKTGSSSAVPETVLSNKEESDRLARSASSPWLAPDEINPSDVSRRRPVSTSGVGDPDVKNSSTTTTPTPFQSSYVPLSRRRQMEQEENEKKKEEKDQSPAVSTISSTSPTSPNSTVVRRSYEPPKRDEERETERKAKARRARETRRSTQGVTKEDLEMAEKTLIAASKGSEPPPEDKSDKENKPEDYSSIRRRAWDDKKEDDKNSSRKSGLSELSSTKSEKDKDKKEEKEDPSQKSSAIRTRRKRENRRPTGKITLEDIQGISEDGDKKNEEEKKEEDQISSSRYGSSRYSDPVGSSSLYDRTSTSPYQSRADRPSSYSGYSRSYTSTSLPDKDTDYKKLYEEERTENEKLKKDVKKLQQDLSEAKLEIEKSRVKNETSRSSYDSSSDKRERRALERKLSELEEELKQMDKIKAENAKLKEENRALTRVVSKLSK